MQKRLVVGIAAALLAGCGSGSSGSSGEFESGSITTAPSDPPLPGQVQTVGQAPRAFADVILPEDGTTLEHLVVANDTLEGARVTAFTQGSEGGQVSISREGLLTYTPPAPRATPFRETFQYTIANAQGGSTATVTALFGPNIYVNNRNLNPFPDGSKGNPFPSIQAALDKAGGNAATIRVDVGDGTTNGYDLPLIQLAEGQAIVGKDASNPPNFRSQFQLPTLECTLQNLRLQGVGSGPLISLRGNSIPTRGNVQLVLQNLSLENHAGVGINAQGAVSAELTNLRLFQMNQQTGPGAIVLTDSLGGVKLSNCVVEVNNQAGIVVQATQTLPVVPTIDIEGYAPDQVTNPLRVTASSGQVNVIVNNFRCQSNNLSGAVVSGAIGGDAKVDARLTNMDTRTIGQARPLDWVYSGTSAGTVRLGNSNNYTSGESLLSTRDAASGALVVSKVPMTADITLNAYNTSTLKFRLEEYARSGIVGQTFNVGLYARDQSTLEARIANTATPALGASSGPIIQPALDFVPDFNGTVKVENLPGLDAENFDGPNSFTGWVPDGSGNYEETGVQDSTQVLPRLAHNYQNLPLNTLGIPRF